MNADELIQRYSALPKKQQAKFDARYKELMQFRRNLATLLDFANAGGNIDLLMRTVAKK